MYNGIKKMNEIIDDIESNITDHIDFDFLAKKMSLSVYEFRRIFSFVVGCPISEYIRKRKLSLAALEILTSDKADMHKISEKYGYSNQSAFTRAFSEYHGFAPTACIEGECEINLFTRPKFEITTGGRECVPMKIITSEEFCINGFMGVSDTTDSCCCENVWNGFYESGIDKTLKTDRLYASYRNQGDDVLCCIGEKSRSGQIKIPATRWVCFEMNTVDDDAVNEIYGKILYELLPSANMKKNGNIPTIEVYPFDMSQDGFSWEIRIPIE